MGFVSLPIPDRDVPKSESAFARALEKLGKELRSGRNVVLHCRQGVGRTGLVAACLLLTKAMDTETAVRRVTQVRGTAVPETPEQRRWIDQYAATLAETHP
jgi:protein-tyrosine phosphatase